MKTPLLLPALFLLMSGCSAGSDSVSSADSVSHADSPTSAVAPEGSDDPGEAIYKKYCIVCHQADGSGLPAGGGRAIAGNFSASGPDSMLSKSDEELLRSIKVGRSGTIGVMPKWMGVLDKQDREDVLGYIRASFTPAPSSGAPGEAPEGTSPEGP
jgi:mono/diheme cytochrome c family protein